MLSELRVHGRIHFSDLATRHGFTECSPISGAMRRRRRVAHGSAAPYRWHQASSLTAPAYAKVACAHFSSGHFGAVDNSAGGGLDLGIRPSLGSQDEGGWGTGGDARRYGRDEIGEDEHSGRDQYQ